MNKKFKAPKMRESASTQYINLKVQHYDKTLGRIICCIRKSSNLSTDLKGVEYKTFISFAFCSPKDTYSRDKGRFIAYQRSCHSRTAISIKLDGLSPTFKRMRIKRLALKVALRTNARGEAKVPWMQDTLNGQIVKAKLRWIR